MARNYFISLPVYQRATFPDRCVICDFQSPDSRLVVKDESNSLISIIFPLISPVGGLGLFPTRKVSAKAPACKACKRKLNRNKLINILTFWGILVSTTITLPPLINPVLPRKFHGLCYFGVFIGMLAILIIVWFVRLIFFQSEFEFIAYEKEISYGFRDGEYAIEFAYLNDALDQFDMTDEEYEEAYF